MYFEFKSLMDGDLTGMHNKDDVPVNEAPISRATIIETPLLRLHHWGCYKQTHCYWCPHLQSPLLHLLLCFPRLIGHPNWPLLEQLTSQPLDYILVLFLHNHWPFRVNNCTNHWNVCVFESLVYIAPFLSSGKPETTLLLLSSSQHLLLSNKRKCGWWWWGHTLNCSCLKVGVISKKKGNVL